MINRIVLLFALFICSATYADSFDVQIGAFRYPDASKIELPANVGELRSTSGPNGLTRFVVGPFSSRPAAEQALDLLKGAGYRGAFIRVAQDQYSAVQSNSSATASATQTYSVNQQSSSTEPSQTELDKLMRLSEEERRNVVYLDGRLHRKVGDEFVPVDD